MAARRGKKSKGEWDAGSIRSLRKHLGCTQNEMAQELGVRQQTISEWETGVYMPRGASRTVLNIIAERAGFTYGSDLATEDTEGSQESPP